MRITVLAHTTGLRHAWSGVPKGLLPALSVDYPKTHLMPCELRGGGALSYPHRWPGPDLRATHRTTLWGTVYQLCALRRLGVLHAGISSLWRRHP